MDFHNPMTAPVGVTVAASVDGVLRFAYSPDLRSAVLGLVSLGCAIYCGGIYCLEKRRRAEIALQAEEADRKREGRLMDAVAERLVPTIAETVAASIRVASAAPAGGAAGRPAVEPLSLPDQLAAALADLRAAGADGVLNNLLGPPRDPADRSPIFGALADLMRPRPATTPARDPITPDMAAHVEAAKGGRS